MLCLIFIVGGLLIMMGQHDRLETLNLISSTIAIHLRHQLQTSRDKQMTSIHASILTGALNQTSRMH